MKQKTLTTIGQIAFLAGFAWSSAASAQMWTTLAPPPQFNPGVTLQLTDGTILVQQIQSSNWWKLTPQLHTINYHSGTLTPVNPFPPSMSYDPEFFASAVLPDGRVIVEGGEYDYGVKDWTTKGAIYDPTAGPLGNWTQVFPPSGWTQIGDVQSVVLPDGTFMMANKCPLPCTSGIPAASAALFDATTLAWTPLTSTGGYTGKFDENTEEGWTLLPDGNLLTVDTYVPLGSSAGTNYEIYDPLTGAWTLGSPSGTVEQLWDSKFDCGGAATHEVGPAVLRPNGTVFATGANSCPGAAGHTAIYDTATGIWTAGPSFPGKRNMLDAPASILINGDVLVDTSPGKNKPPSTFYTFDGTKFHKIVSPTDLPSVSTEGGRMLVLPSGDVLFTQFGSPQIWFFTPAGTYQPAWQPTITTYPADVYENCTYTVSGTQFNGLSQGAAYGDDAQSATNFPLVLFTNSFSGDQFFARTHNFSTMAVATGAANVSTEFDVLTAGFEAGDGTMVVIANGIPSKPVGITLHLGGVHGPC